VHRAVQGCVSGIVIFSIFSDYFKKVQVTVAKYLKNTNLSKK